MSWKLFKKRIPKIQAVFFFFQGNPITANIGDNIYVKVSLNNNDYGTKMRLDTCEAMPEATSTSQSTYVIIKNGWLAHFIARRTISREFENFSRNILMIAFCFTDAQWIQVHRSSPRERTRHGSCLMHSSSHPIRTQCTFPVMPHSVLQLTFPQNVLRHVVMADQK